MTAHYKLSSELGSNSSHYLKDMVHIKRPFDAKINKEPEKPLNKSQRDMLIKKVLPAFIIAYKKRMDTWNLVEDTENGKAYNNYVAGFNPEETAKKISSLKKEIKKYQERINKLVLRLKEKGSLTKLQKERLQNYKANIKEFKKEITNTQHEFKLGKFYEANGRPRLADDDIGQEAVLFFYRCLDKFDLAPYEGAIDTYNHKSKEGKKTKKTLEFYFQNFAFDAITNMAKDAIKRLVSYGFSAHNSGGSNTPCYQADAVIENSDFLDKSQEDEEYSFDQAVKIDLVNMAISEIEDDEFKKFVISRIHLPKDMVQQQYKRDFSRLNSRFLELKKDIQINFERERMNYKNQGASE